MNNKFEKIREKYLLEGVQDKNFTYACEDVKKFKTKIWTRFYSFFRIIYKNNYTNC